MTTFLLRSFYSKGKWAMAVLPGPGGSVSVAEAAAPGLPRPAEQKGAGGWSPRGGRAELCGAGGADLPLHLPADPESGQTAGATGARRRVRREDGLRLGSRGAAGMCGWERGAESGVSPGPEGTEECGAGAGGGSRE